MNNNRQIGEPLSSEYRIDEVCDAYEAEWLRGGRPQIADFIERAADRERGNLFYELLLVELEYRQHQGELPTREEYLHDFPQFAEKIEAANFQFGKSAFATSAGDGDDTVRVRVHQPGSLIGRFELLEQLGAGAMGEVWKAWDPRLQRPVAVKLPRAQALCDADLRRFLREGRAAAQLRHPQLASVHEVCREGDTAYIVADYVEGQNLRRHLQASKLSVNEPAKDSAKRRLKYAVMAELCAEVAEALHHAHEQGIVHRDLKPANIIIDGAGRPHVIDFGLAKWSNDDRDLTLQGELLGTPAYMSPEQAGGDAASLDRRTDVYSLGVILYEMLTGECPFSGGQASVIHQILAADPAKPRNLNQKIPRDLETICIKALEKAPDRRYATMQEMAVDLHRFARGEPILARRTGPLERSWRWIRRRPGMGAAMLAIVLIVSISGMVIRSLTKTNSRLQGFVTYRITTNPPGATLAFVPIDKGTGEPGTNPSAVVRPQGRTPLTALLKPGPYLVEAVIEYDGKEPDFVEAYETLLDPVMYSPDKRSDFQKRGIDAALRIKIPRTRDVVANMIAVSIDEQSRKTNPLLPKLLYVDVKETALNVVEPEHAGMPQQMERTCFDRAASITQNGGKRLPTAAEYEAILKAIEKHELSSMPAGHPAALDDLSGGLAEWTTTKYDFRVSGEAGAIADLRSMHVLKGYGDPTKFRGLRRMPDGTIIASPDSQSPLIGFRGVRSGAPRFVTPDPK
jgi:serine/threonine protein kinase